MRVNRRGFLKAAGIGAGIAVAGAGTYEALALSGYLPSWLRTPVPPVDRNQIWHALNRVTFGPRPGQVDAVTATGLQRYLEQQLDPTSINDDAAQRRLGNYVTLDLTPAEMLRTNVDQSVMIDELDTFTIMRAIYSERQLYEVMVNFWSEHFSIWHQKGYCPYLKTIDDRDVIRRYALSTFRELLGASAKSPAMLDYLDNVVSDKNHPNENYARELLELHTLGVGHYSEKDVKEVARCFTGWTMITDEKPHMGEFTFVADMHDNEQKIVLGHTIPAGGGIKDGQIVLDILATHPATAQRICQKLCRRFVSDNPSTGLVTAATQEFTRSGGNIPSVLRTIFASQEFLQAPPRFKRPFEYVIALYRALDVRISTAESLDALSRLEMMGHRPFNHPSPEGYSDLSSHWVGNMLSRWNVGIDTTTSKSYGIQVDLFRLARRQGVKATTHDFVNYYAQHLLGRTLHKAESDLLLDFISKAGKPDVNTGDGQNVLVDIIALMTASPAYQYR